MKAFAKFRLFLGFVGLVGVAVLFGREIFYSLGAKYPEDRTPVYLAQDLSVPGTGRDKGSSYYLVHGSYAPVLSNGHGTFYLAPSLGFNVNTKESRGIGVGGIWIPSSESGKCYVWEYQLVAGTDRASRKKLRKLAMEQDQPEWKSLQESDYYAGKSFTLLNDRPLIKFKFEVDRAALKKGSAQESPAALRAQLEVQYKELTEARANLDTPEKIKLFNEKAAAYQKGKERLKALETKR